MFHVYDIYDVINVIIFNEFNPPFFIYINQFKDLASLQ